MNCTFRSVDTDAFKSHTAVHGENVSMQCIFCDVVFDVEALLKVNKHSSIKVL